ncbi:hypothetical protein BD408DRAFT_416353 [Parasitella parasitica]|nr:hypothetical protein BD408DRAFT_416353 [Parasitella parasitica]
MGNLISSRKRRAISERKSYSASVFSVARTASKGSTKKQLSLTNAAFPSTMGEAKRQRGEHYLLKHVFQTSYFAPIDDILSEPSSTCLDIGCGAHASWLIDIANDFPNCTFHGFDIIQPFSLHTADGTGLPFHIPPNCKLEKRDLFEGFGHPDSTFDYVHQRSMHLVYESAKVDWMYSEMIRVTKENGWIELVEPEVMPKRAGPMFGKIMAGICSVLKAKLGKSLHEADTLSKKMEAFGLIDVEADYGSVPVCWGGYVGKLAYEDILMMLQHLGPALYEYLDLGRKFNKETYDAFVDCAFNECVEFQTFFNVRWAYGRKSTALHVQ